MNKKETHFLPDGSVIIYNKKNSLWERAMFSLDLVDNRSKWNVIDQYTDKDIYDLLGIGRSANIVSVTNQIYDTLMGNTRYAQFDNNKVTSQEIAACSGTIEFEIERFKRFKIVVTEIEMKDG